MYTCTHITQKYCLQNFIFDSLVKKINQFLSYLVILSVCVRFGQGSAVCVEARRKHLESFSITLHQFSAAGSLTEPEDRLPGKQTRRNLQSVPFQYWEHRCSLHLALSSFFRLIFWFHTNILLKILFIHCILITVSLPQISPT